MACVGLVNGCRTVASVLSDEDWKKVVKISKGRQVLMPDTKLPAQAKTLRRDGGITRYFSHFPERALRATPALKAQTISP